MKRFRFTFKKGSPILPALFFLAILLPTPAPAAETLFKTLKNGLRVVVVRNTLAAAVSVQVNYLAGSNEAPEGFPGIAHALEHMMFRGSRELSGEQTSTVLAALGGEFNAETQQTVTRYTATVAAEDLDAVLRLEASRMTGALNEEKAWNEERGSIIQEVEQDLSTPQYLLSVKLLERLFSGTPYAHDALGTRDSFKRTEAAMLRRFYRSWYAPNNAVLVIVGDVDTRRALSLVKKRMVKIPARRLPPRKPVLLKPLVPASFTLQSDLPYGIAVVAFRLPGYASADFAAGQVLADVLASRRGNLYGLVPKGESLSADFESMAFPKAGAGFALVGFSGEGEGPRLIGSVKKIVADYLKKGIPAELVEAAKRHEIADAEFQKDSLEGLADAWSQAVAVEGRRSPQDQIEAIRRVTVAQVNRVARRYLSTASAVTAVMAPRPSGKPVEGKGFNRGKESFTPPQAQPATIPAWARKLVQALPPPPKKEEPAEFRLPNGLRLIVLPKPIGETVHVFGRVKNEPDLETPPGKEGVDEVLSALFPYGTRSLDRLALQAALDDIAADLAVGDSFYLRVPQRDAERGVELLAENLLHPALPEEGFAVVRRQTAEGVAGRLKSAAWLAQHALDRALYPKEDPALRHPTSESVTALTLEDVKNYHRTVFRPDLTTIVVTGAITADRAKALIAERFGSWRGEGPVPPTDLPAVPPNPPAEISVPDLSRSQDEVELEETLGLTRSHPDYYPLQVGLHVLSGGFYATRLYRDLRERTGLVYAVEAVLKAGKTRSSLAVYYGCDPENVGKARGLVERNIEEMGKVPVTERELRQAKTLLLKQLLLGRTSLRSIAEQFLHFALLDLPLNEAHLAAERFARADAEAIRKAFQTWLRPGGFAQVSRGPAPQP